MLPELLIAFAIFALAILGMAIGVIVSRKRLKGTCGGLANLRDEEGNSLCEACTNPSPDCRGENAKTAGEPEETVSGATRKGATGGSPAIGATGGLPASAAEQHATTGGSAAR